MTDPPDLSERARRLRNAVEPLAAGIYFAPEAHDAYAALGFNGSPGANDGVQMPDGVAYFASRGVDHGDHDLGVEHAEGGGDHVTVDLAEARAA